MFDDNPDRPGADAAPAGIPRITVTPNPPAGRMFDDNPDRPAASSHPARPSDRVRELIAEQSKMSWPAWLNQGAGDFTAAGADMASFGNRPRLDAATGAITGTYPDYSTGLDEELKQARVRAERSPIANMLGNVAGGVAGGVGAGTAKVGANIAGRVMPYMPASLAKALGFGAEAGAVGAGQAAGHTYSGNFDDYWKNATEGFATSAPVGAVLGPLTPTSAVKMRPGDPKTGQPILPPSDPKLEKIVEAGYKKFEGIPATYSSKGFNAHLDAAERDMVAKGAMPTTAAPVYEVMKNLREGKYGFANAAGDIGPQQIETARRALNTLTNTVDTSAKAGTGARILRGQMEDFVQNPGANVTSAPQHAAEAARVINIVRPNAAALFRSRQLTDPATNAAMKEGRGGTSVGDQLGAKADRILETKGGKQPKTRGWIDEERDMVAAAVKPTWVERRANDVAAAAPWLGGVAGGGLGGTGGAITGNIPGALSGGLSGTALGAGAGLALKRGLEGFSSRGIANRWNDAAAAMRARSPAYQKDIQGSVPVAGPGQGWLPQSLQGATASQFGTPYDDGREALVPSMLRQFSY
jgi:hypothetical protein